jgi:hypothetical protein
MIIFGDFLQLEWAWTRYRRFGLLFCGTQGSTILKSFFRYRALTPLRSACFNLVVRLT